eukprot:6556149-Lingulodinium_polyedra.AAC.1
MGKELVEALKRELSTAKFRKRAECLICNTDCPTDPKEDRTIQARWHVEVAGITCVAWSTMVGPSASVFGGRFPQMLP